MSSQDLVDLVRLEDPSFYSENPFPIFARMRKEAPVFWYEPLDTFVLTKYDDVRYVGRNPEIFVSTEGILLNDFRHKSIVKEFFPVNAEVIGTTDPPRHRELRRFIEPSFTPRSVNKLEDQIRTTCRELIESIVPGEVVPFVEQIGAVLPLKTVAFVTGLPGDNIKEMKYWADEMIKMGAAFSKEELLEAAAHTRPMHAYIDEWTVRSLGSTGPELIPTLLRAKLEGGDLSYENLHMFMGIMLAAGNETTRDFLTGSMFTYAEHPDQRELLVKESELHSSAGEECLRWITPVRGFARTLTQDVELRGQQIRRGQRVHMLWMAANRDEEIWDRADSFDIRRKPNPMHVAFGFGQHACVGASLARLEGRVFFEELVKVFPNWSIAGDPERPFSILHNSFDELPIVFSR